jgi:hypothetical protein
VHRTCGAAAIGSVAGCGGRGGDIAEFGRSSEDVVLFERGCDDPAAGERVRLTAYATRIGPDDDVSVDGFASEEGDAGFNVDLSCARAKAAADILTAAGATPRTLAIYAHGGVPGDRRSHRSVVITITPVPESRPDPAAPPAPAGPAAPAPPAATTEDCRPWQTTMLNEHLAAARTWVDDASRKIADYAFVFASSRHSTVPASPATAAVVGQALLDNFHTTAPGDVLEIRDGFASLRAELNHAMTYECEDSCDKNELAYVRGGFAFIRRMGHIHVCPLWFTSEYFSRVQTLVHERAHQHPGATDNAYDWQSSYATLSPADAIDNADSYAVAARQIFHGGAHGPGT